MKHKTKQPPIELLLQILDEGYEKRTWHGPNLRQSLRGVNSGAATWRPAPGRHNIWEIAVHAAYWKYAVRRRLQGGRRGSFAMKGSNWFAPPTPATEAAWRQVRELLEDEHQKLRAAVADLRHGKSQDVRVSMIFGVAFHDVYHAGQIRMLRRLRSRGKRG